MTGYCDHALLQEHRLQACLFPAGDPNWTLALNFCKFRLPARRWRPVDTESLSVTDIAGEKVERCLNGTLWGIGHVLMV